MIKSYGVKGATLRDSPVAVRNHMTSLKIQLVTFYDPVIHHCACVQLSHPHT